MFHHDEQSAYTHNSCVHISTIIMQICAYSSLHTYELEFDCLRQFHPTNSSQHRLERTNMASNSNYFQFSLLIIIFTLSATHIQTQCWVSNATLCNGLLTTDKFKQKSVMNGIRIVEDAIIHSHAWSTCDDELYSLPLNLWWLSHFVCLHFKSLWILSVCSNFEFIISARTKKNQRTRILKEYTHLTLTWSKKRFMYGESFSAGNYNCDVRLFLVRSYIFLLRTPSAKILTYVLCDRRLGVF